ncbi:MAG TPA: two-component regulator propeller domain-containing protein [Ferruginibacter sp.]|nr:two-component regulator propeller domain-containing protein [Ferruginibacter sp.]
MNNTNRTLLLICFFFFFAYNSHAQQYIFKKYTVEDGLVANPVRCIYQDSKGFIWVGTWEGLSKYDGHKFTNYTIANGLSHNLVNDIIEMADAKLYVAVNNGSIDVIEQDVIVKKISLSNIVFNRFNKIKNQGLIATTDSNGIYEIRNGKFSKPTQSFPDSTYHDLEELNDSLLIGGAEGDLRILNRRYQFFDKIKRPWEVAVNKIFTDSKKNVWLGTSVGLKQVLSTQKKGQPAVFYLADVVFSTPVLKNSQVNDILEDTNGNLWIATSHSLVKIDPNGNEQVFGEKEGLPSSNVSSICQDNEKNIWIGTYLGLAKLVTKNNIRFFTTENGLSSNLTTFILPLNNNKLIIGTEKSIQTFTINNQLFSAVTSQHSFFYNGLVKNSPPLLFFQSDNHFGRYDSVNHKIADFVLPGPPKSDVYYSAMDAKGTIFNGTQRGLVIYSGKQPGYETKFTYRITYMHIDKKGFLWLGTWTNGLFRIQLDYKENNSGDPQKSPGNLVSFSIQDFSHLVPDKNIRCLFEDSKGNMWVGTRYKGVVQFTNNGEQSKLLKHFDVQKGLMSEWTRTITEDAKGNIWIGSNLGLDKLIAEGNNFRVFNFSRVNNYFAHINVILPLENNSLWLTTINGLVNITDEESEKTPPYRVYITSVDLKDTTFNYGLHSRGTKVNLSYSQNQAEFEFSAPSYLNEKQTLYSYRLTGSADTSWSIPSNIHNVSYASLQPGNYKFEVRTLGWNEVWGQPENFSFSIQPPYWKRWWFYSMIAFLLIIFFYAFYLYRIRQLLRMQNVRNRIASDLHDDIGSTLTNINMLSEISRKNLDQPREAEKFLHRISEEVTATSQALNDIIWSVNSRNDSMEEILSRMRRYAAELFDNSNTNCNLTLDESIAGKKISMEQRRDVYLIYKELMNNVVRHASAKNVWVDVHLQNGKLRLIIKDDGKGFEPMLVTNRNGLKNIRSRVTKWKGNVEIESQPGEGTTIEILIPLNE